MNKKDVNTLKLHVDGMGLVWYSVGTGPSVASNKSISEFLSNLGSRDKYIRIMGVQDNIPLILKLYLFKQSDQISGLEVCSPLIASSCKSDRMDEILYCLRQWEGKQASQGGWHEFTDKDYATYQIAKSVKDPDNNPDILSGFSRHFLFPYMSFIRDINTLACCRLVALILDPRFYVDLTHPDRSAKLEYYLGLDPYFQRHASAGEACDTKSARCALVLSVWKSSSLPEDYKTDPGCFLWRLREKYKKEKYKKDREDNIADLIASQHFICYLRHVWLDAIYANKQVEPLFVPEHFFDSQEALALQQHLNKMKASPGG